MTRRATVLLALLAVGVACRCIPADAQRLLVRTTTLTAAGEAVRVYMTTVDMHSGRPLLYNDSLPGPVPLGPILLSPDATRAFASSGASWRQDDPPAREDYTCLSSMETAPFRLVQGGGFLSEAGWRQVVGCLASDAGAPMLVLLGSHADADGAWQGRLDALHCPTTPPEAVRPLELAASWPLPGVPVQAVGLGESRVAVLCRGFLGTGALLHVLDVATGAVLLDGHELAVEQTGHLGTEPVAIALSRDGAFLVILTSGYALDRASGQAASWLHAWDVARLTDAGQLVPLGSPLELPGVAQPGILAVQPAEANTWWIATHSPGVDFAHAVCVQVTAQGVEKVAEPSFSDVRSPLLVAPAPEGRAVAVAVNQRLEIWPDGLPPGVSHSYEGPIRALAWTPEGLFLGDAGRIHCVEPASAAPLVSIQLRSGVVTDIVPLPAATLPGPDADADGLTDAEEARLGTNPALPDSDGDGIPDGVDPEPLLRSPRAEAPSVISFREEAAGRELRAVLVKPARTGSTWRLDYDKARMPWLRAYPLSGESPVFYMGIDPSEFARAEHREGGAVTLSVTGTTPNAPAAGSPAEIQVRVLPEGSAMHRILWVVGGADDAARADDAAQADAGAGSSTRALGDARFRPLADLLAGPPYFFVHHQAVGPFLDALTPYTVVVLTAEAAARGALTRQAVLDYVTQGGALLFVGSYLAGEESAALREWLSPAGVTLDPKEKIEGQFAGGRSHWLGRYWDNFRISRGCTIRVQDRSSRVVPAGREAAPPMQGAQCVLALPSYGYGRLAILASDTPIESAAMKNDSNCRFADALFRWLARAGKEVEDLDGDGLPDRIEDRNGNGAVDPGETDPLNPDTDGDGIPDGKEDANRNAAVDEGETSPLNPDSNGNGIYDGGDPSPLPPIDAPHVANADPNSGPSEGGTKVLISGRNLAPDCEVWFGPRRAAAVRSLGAGALFAETPSSESTDGGRADIRVLNPARQLEGVLPSGYSYTPLSTITLSLARIGSSSMLYTGTVSVRLQCDPATAVGRISLYIEAAPAPEGKPSGVFSWGDLTPGRAAEFAGRRVIKRPAPTGGIWIDVSPGRRERSPGELAVVRWECSVPLYEANPIGLTIRRARAMAPNGVPLLVTTQGLELYWDSPV